MLTPAVCRCFLLFASPAPVSLPCYYPSTCCLLRSWKRRWTPRSPWTSSTTRSPHANACCYTLRPRTTPLPEETSIPWVIHGALLRADVNAATPSGSRGRSVLCAGCRPPQGPEVITSLHAAGKTLVVRTRSPARQPVSHGHTAYRTPVTPNAEQASPAAPERAPQRHCRTPCEAGRALTTLVRCAPGGLRAVGWLCTHLQLLERSAVLPAPLFEPRLFTKLYQT